MSLSELLYAEQATQARRWATPLLDVPRITASQLEELAADARAEAYAQGRAEGLARGAAEARQLIASLKTLTEQLRQPLAAIDAGVQNMVVELSLRIGSQLALRELRQDPAALLELVREALGLLTPAPLEPRIRLHPQDLETLREVLAQEPQPAWQLEADATLAPGDCRVAGDHAAVDARMSVRVAEIAKSLFGEG